MSAEVGKLICEWITGGVADEARRDGAAKVLSYGLRMKVVAIVLGVFSMAFMIWTSVELPKQDARVITMGTCTAGGLGLGVGYFLLTAFVSRIKWEGDQLRVRSFWGREREVFLSEVTDWNWGRFSQGYVLQTREGAKLKLSLWLDGAEELVRELKRRQRPSR